LTTGAGENFGRLPLRMTGFAGWAPAMPSSFSSWTRIATKIHAREAISSATPKNFISKLRIFPLA
jgi:hypothetical protein